MDIAKIRERASKATPGPWYSDDESIYTFDDGKIFEIEITEENSTGVLTDDVSFIVAARTDVEALCDEVERLREFAEQSIMAMDAAQAHLRRGVVPKDYALAELDEAMKVNPTNMERINERGGGMIIPVKENKDGSTIHRG